MALKLIGVACLMIVIGVVVGRFLRRYRVVAFWVSGRRSFGASRFDAPRQMCVAQVNSARSTKALSYITECPQVMQPRRLR